MITIYIDIEHGIVVSSEETEGGFDEDFTKLLVQDIAEAASVAFNRRMGIGEILH